MRFVFIRTFRLKRLYIYTLAVASLLVLMGLNSVFADTNSTPVTSWVMSNRTVVIDPGHGGIDPGAVGYSGLEEKDIVLQVGKRLEKLLNHAGAKVLMTRTSDTDLSTPGSGSLLKRKREDLSKRVALANNNKASIYLSIHVNSFPSARWRGAQTFYQTSEDESKKLAECIQSELIRVMGNTSRAAKASDFYTTKHTKMPGVIVEIGFISNPEEAKLLKKSSYQRKLANAIYSGLIKYYTDPQDSSQTKPKEAR